MGSERTECFSSLKFFILSLVHGSYILSILYFHLPAQPTRTQTRLSSKHCVLLRTLDLLAFLTAKRTGALEASKVIKWGWRWDERCYEMNELERLTLASIARTMMRKKMKDSLHLSRKHELLFSSHLFLCSLVHIKRGGGGWRHRIGYYIVTREQPMCISLFCVSLVVHIHTGARVSASASKQAASVEKWV